MLHNSTDSISEEPKSNTPPVRVQEVEQGFAGSLLGSSCDGIQSEENINEDNNEQESNWICNVCTLENSTNVSTCGACEAPAPKDDDNKNGWTCSRCTFINEENAIQCETCELAK